MDVLPDPSVEDFAQKLAPFRPSDGIGLEVPGSIELNAGNVLLVKEASILEMAIDLPRLLHRAVVDQGQNVEVHRVFSQAVDALEHQRLGYQHWQAYNFHYNYYNYWWYEDEPEKQYSSRYEPDTEADQAIAFMEKYRQSGRPFFLTVAPHPPHPPFDPAYAPEGYLERTPQTLWWPPNVPANNPCTDDELRCYLGMIQNADDNLGRLLDYLESSGLARNTIVIFTSDHGEMFGSQGRTQKMVPYAEDIDIPLIMRWPRRIAPGSRVDTLQTPMDHFPTLCGLAGLPIPGEVDGADLSGVATGEDRDGREDLLIGQYSSGELWFETGTTWPEWRGVRTKQYTYVRWLAGGEELYDNLADPYQMANLAEGGAEPEVLVRLRSRLSDLRAVAHDDFRPGTGYGDWYDDCRNLVRTALGPVPG